MYDTSRRRLSLHVYYDIVQRVGLKIETQEYGDLPTF